MIKKLYQLGIFVAALKATSMFIIEKIPMPAFPAVNATVVICITIILLAVVVPFIIGD